MKSGSLMRTPPRRRFAWRIAAASSIVFLALSVGIGRADAYPCGAPPSAPERGLAMPQGDDCRRSETPKPAERAEPNLVSLAFFVAALFGVMLIPIGYSRRGDTEPPIGQ
jgi:hypothetical protein